VPVIAPAERAVLLEAARQLNRWTTPARPRRGQQSGPAGRGRPGDDFGAAADWEDVLVPHGWVPTGTSGGTTYWRRPGKDAGTSATTGFCGAEEGADLLYVFSSNAAPFEEQASYSKFAAYALLEHGGDFRAAARALRAQGYGAGPGPPRRR
jgi:putative DNA primase/helicase